MEILSLAATLCFSRRAGYELAPGFTFSLPFIVIPHSTTQLHYTNTYTVSHPNLNFLQYAIQILIPHVTWSAQVVHESKIDHTKRFYLPCAVPKVCNSEVGWHWKTHTHTHTRQLNPLFKKNYNINSIKVIGLMIGQRGTIAKFL